MKQVRAVKQAINCAKNFKHRPSEDDEGTKSDNEESDKSCYLWPNGLGNHQTCKDDEIYLRWVLIWQFRFGDEGGLDLDFNIARPDDLNTLGTPPPKKKTSARQYGQTRWCNENGWLSLGVVGSAWVGGGRKSSVDGERLDGPSIFVACGSWNPKVYQKTGWVGGATTR